MNESADDKIPNFKLLHFFVLFVLSSAISFIVLCEQNKAGTLVQRDWVTGFAIAAVYFGLWFAPLIGAVYLTFHCVLRAIARKTTPVSSALKWFAASLPALLLMALHFPAYFPALNMQVEAALKGTTRDVQIAAENYQKEHHCYPTNIDDSFKSYFPNKKAPFNFYTQKEEWPSLGNLKNPALARELSDAPIAPGVIEYSPLCDETGRARGYAIRVGRQDGTAVRAVGGKVLILSNINE